MEYKGGSLKEPNILYTIFLLGKNKNKKKYYEDHSLTFLSDNNAVFKLSPLSSVFDKSSKPSLP